MASLEDGKRANEEDEAAQLGTSPGAGDSPVWQRPTPTTTPRQHNGASNRSLRARKDHRAQDEREISFKRGDVLLFVDKDEEGWVLGKHPNGRAGWFPIDCVTEIVPEGDEPLLPNKDPGVHRRTFLTHRDNISTDLNTFLKQRPSKQALKEQNILRLSTEVEAQASAAETDKKKDVLGALLRWKARKSNKEDNSAPSSASSSSSSTPSLPTSASSGNLNSSHYKDYKSGNISPSTSLNSLALSAPPGLSSHSPASSPSPGRKESSKSKKEKAKEAKRDSANAKREAKRKSKLKRSEASMFIDKLSSPTSFEHRLHVDFEFNWEGDPLDVLKLSDKLGEGAYGAVYKAQYIHTNYVMAVKMVPFTQDKKAQDEVRQEINVLRRCRHPNIVSYYGCCVADNILWILMQYCQLGSLADVMSVLRTVLGKGLTEPQIGALLKQSLQGLAFLHQEDIAVIHRDLKAGNVLLSEEGEVKIADFGISFQQTGSRSKAQTLIGTPLFMSPEMLDGQRYGFATDIWSLGITAIEMADGVPPYISEHPMRALYLLVTNDSPTVKDPKAWSPEFNSFIAACLQKEPTKRPSASELLNHPFIKKVRDDKSKDILLDLIQTYQTAKRDFNGSSQDNNNSGGGGGFRLTDTSEGIQKGGLGLTTLSSTIIPSKPKHNSDNFTLTTLSSETLPAEIASSLRDALKEATNTDGGEAATEDLNDGDETEATTNNNTNTHRLLTEVESETNNKNEEGVVFHDFEKTRRLTQEQREAKKEALRNSLYMKETAKKEQQKDVAALLSERRVSTSVQEKVKQFEKPAPVAPASTPALASVSSAQLPRSPRPASGSCDATSGTNKNNNSNASPTHKRQHSSPPPLVHSSNSSLHLLSLNNNVPAGMERYLHMTVYQLIHELSTLTERCNNLELELKRLKEEKKQGVETSNNTTNTKT